MQFSIPKNTQAVMGIPIGKLQNHEARIAALETNGSGGGFTVWTPTETPNGVLTVFTFSAATTQPSFIVLDGAQQRAVAKSGTVNWTWAAGPKQATMAIPPTDDIVAIK